MCNLDYADNSYLKVYEARPVAAWKQQCDDCGRVIVKGERYEVVVWSEWQPVENIDDDLAKPVGDLWRRAAETRRPGLRARPFTGGRHGSDMLVEFTRDLARLVLYSGARFDLCDSGWAGPSVQSCYHDSGPVVARTREHPWTDRYGHLVAPWVISHWVDRALTVYCRTIPADQPQAA